MRISKLLTLIFVIISAYIITSCAATQPQEKLLIGTWKPHKAAPYVPNDRGTPAITGMKVDTAHPKKASGNTSNPAVMDEKQREKIQRVIETTMRTTLKLNSNKTCEVQLPGKMVEGTWKLKNKGNNLVFKDRESGQKTTLEFVFLNDTTAMAIQRTKVGDIIIRFRKQ